jgi:hypothetical protein
LPSVLFVVESLGIYLEFPWNFRTLKPTVSAAQAHFKGSLWKPALIVELALLR